MTDWRYLGASITIADDGWLSDRWLSHRHEIFSALWPGWLTLYASMDPLLGLIMRRLDELPRSMERLLDDAMFSEEKP